MTLLILGLALWWSAHLFKRIAPTPRARLGDRGKGPVALALLAAVVLMVIGYRGAEMIVLWTPPAFLTHVNNLLMVLAFYLFAAAGSKTWITTKIRHPQLTGFKTWAVAHLLVNGDLASVVLFGGLLAWA
ncbi:MAG: NnrU family protein, partial [Paracoccaceae bacterium]